MLHHVDTKIANFYFLRNIVTKPVISTVVASVLGCPWLLGRASVRLERSLHLLGHTRTLTTLTHKLVNPEDLLPEPKSTRHGLELDRRLVKHGYPFNFWNPKKYVIMYNRQTLDLQTSSERYAPGRMKASIQIASVPTVDTPGTTVILQCDDQRYLFGNLGEGSQRTALEFDWKLSKITHMFLTGRIEWKTVGGLFGTVLTLAESVQAAQTEKLNQTKKPKGSRGHAQTAEKEFNDPDASNAGKQRLNVYGGPNLTYMIATARRFIFRKGMPLDVNELDEDDTDSSPQPVWSDKHIRVWAMGVQPTTYKEAPSVGQPHSPRKRSFDEFSERVGLERPDDMKTLLDNDRQICKAVVGDMFDSDWHLDSLVKMPLKHVQMPANVYVRNPETHRIERFRLPEQDSDDQAPLPDINVLVRKPWPAALVSELPRTTPSTTATSYFVRCQSQRGKFQMEKARALNVQPGPLFADLTNGKSVLSRDGRRVHPKDVIDPDIPGNGFAVIDLPTPLYIKDLTERPEWKTAEIMEGLKHIIWNLGPGVGEDEHLQTFLTFLNTMFKIENVISSSDYSPNILAFPSVAISAIRLREIDPNRFSKLISVNHQSNTAIHKKVPKGTLKAVRGWNRNLHPIGPFQRDYLQNGFELSAIAREVPAEIKALAMSVRAELMSQDIVEKIQSQNLFSPEAEIVCLGTGSAQPSKYRNVSSTLLRVPGYGSYILDCGENTLGQLRRIYSDDELAGVLRDLKMIWISHLHADHHLGIVSVIKAWHRAVHGSRFIPLDEHQSNIAGQPIDPIEALREVKRLFIASDAAMNRWLAEYAGVEDYGYDKLIPLDVSGINVEKKLPTHLSWEDKNVSFGLTSDQIRQAMRAATGLFDLSAANVDHCHGAKAVALTFPNGFKFAFSGDCRPSKDFIRIGKGCTVLLHEATFDDELQGDALAKKHCTTSEAIGVGVAMGAKRILLTHFSQRYQKIPIMSSLDAKTKDTVMENGNDSTETQDSEFANDASDNSGTGPFAGDQFSDAVDGQLPKLFDSPLKRSCDNSTSSNAHDLPNPSPSTAAMDTVTIEPPSKALDLKVGVAFDYMRVKVKDIMILEKLTPPLTALFDHYEKGKEAEKERNKAGMTDRERKKAEKREKATTAQNLSILNRKESKKSLRSDKKSKRPGGALDGEMSGAADAVVQEAVGRTENEMTEQADDEKVMDMKPAAARLGEGSERKEEQDVEVEKVEDKEMIGVDNEERKGAEDGVPNRAKDEEVEQVEIEKVDEVKDGAANATGKQSGDSGLDQIGKAAATGGETMESDSEEPKPLQATG